ncbi:MAG: hypothetical protein MR209_01910, partial [Veillonellaceae bacterium]|nr:hypothetical protein [Veillonellaceae bacterium]
AKSETMVNAGVTWRFGGDDERKNLPERYQAGPISSVYVLQDEVAALQKQNAQLASDNETAQARVAAIDAENKAIRAQNEEIRAQNERILAELAALRQAVRA